MRLEGLVWFTIGGLVLLLSLYYVVTDVVTEPDLHLALIFGLFIGFGAFFFMGLGLMMMIKEITKSAVT
jgi:hypothetical protein